MGSKPTNLVTFPAWDVLAVRLGDNLEIEWLTPQRKHLLIGFLLSSFAGRTYTPNGVHTAYAIAIVSFYYEIGIILPREKTIEVEKLVVPALLKGNGGINERQYAIAVFSFIHSSPEL